jgi:outer membrane protein OmpA-like peptidoglycan-associated protein
MRTVVMSILACGTVLGSTTVLADDCAIGARYSALAEDRLAAGATDDAIAFLQKSVEACPTYDTYEKLGEMSADSIDAADAKRAVNAFVSAYSLAPSDKTRARALTQYAKLLNARCESVNADPLVRQAQSLDSTNPETRALAAQIGENAAHSTAECIRRGLKESLFVPLRPVSLNTNAGAGQVLAMPARPAPPAHSVDIRINFDTNTTAVDADTRQNVVELSKALRDRDFQDHEFIFVGHADERGNERHNLKLSQERAQTIYQTLLLMDPTLEGRVEVIGRGSSEPLDPGHDARAYRANRRLQVILK